MNTMLYLNSLSYVLKEKNKNTQSLCAFVVLSHLTTIFSLCLQLLKYMRQKLYN